MKYSCIYLNCERTTTSTTTTFRFYSFFLIFTITIQLYLQSTTNIYLIYVQSIFTIHSIFFLLLHQQFSIIIIYKLQKLEYLINIVLYILYKRFFSTNNISTWYSNSMSLCINRVRSNFYHYSSSRFQ